MSDTKTLTKSQRKRQKRSEKRKASTSPLTVNSGHYSPCATTVKGKKQNTTQSPCAIGEEDFLNVSESFVQAVMSYNASPIQDYSQNSYQVIQPSQTLLTPQTPQTPNQGQVPTTFQTPVMMNTSPHPQAIPNWAIQIMQDVRAIKAALPKIDEIDRSVKQMSMKITAVENEIKTLNTKVNDINSKVNDMEKSVEYINEEHETQKKDLTENKKAVTKLQETVTNFKTQNEAMQDKILDLESRSMRENLIFYGIAETIGSNVENCETLTKEVISNHLELDSTQITMDRAHRLGGTKSKKPRPIVVKFHKYKDREAVRMKSREESVKEILKDNGLGIGIQSPQTYRAARNALKEYAEQEEAKGSKVRITGNKLYVNNKETMKYVDGKIQIQDAH